MGQLEETIRNMRIKMKRILLFCLSMFFSSSAVWTPAMEFKERISKCKHEVYLQALMQISKAGILNSAILVDLNDRLSISAKQIINEKSDYNSETINAIFRRSISENLSLCQ
jgi:hypothetical protein